MKTTFVLLRASLICLVIQGQSVKITSDPFTGLSAVVADLGSQKDKTFPFPKSVGLNVIAFPYPRSPRYLLVASLVRDNWAFISSGESLIFKLDGQWMPLQRQKGGWSDRKIITGYLGGLVSESATYELSHEQLMKLGEAKEKAFRLIGQEDIFTSTLNDQAEEAIKALLTLLPPGGAPWTILNNRIALVEENPLSKEEENLSLPPISELNRLAKVGDREAQYLLGNALRYGKGIQQDIPMSVKLFSLAAEQGHPMAQYKMGTASILGVGVSQDPIRAHMWFNLAADQGVELAKKTRDMIESQMTPQQIAQAQELARNWKTKK